jgi:hypothetical protein
MDKDVKTALNEAALAEQHLNHKWIVPDKKDLPKPHPVDYFVPDFGMDPDIEEAIKNEQLAK